MDIAHKNQADLQSVSTVLEQTGLRKIIQKAEFLITLDRIVQTLLPTSFAPHCQVMNLNEYTLVLGVTSAAIGTRIQFMSEDLLKSLRKERRFEKILNIRCKVIEKITR